MLRWQALTVTSVIPIVWVDFSKICLHHPSTTASLMFCRFAKFWLKQKTCSRNRQRPTMADFHRQVKKFWQRFPKCDPYLKVEKHLNHWLISNFTCSVQCCYQNDMHTLLWRHYEVICNGKPLYWGQIFAKEWYSFCFFVKIWQLNREKLVAIVS